MSSTSGVIELLRCTEGHETAELTTCPACDAVICMADDCHTEHFTKHLRSIGLDPELAARLAATPELDRARVVALETRAITSSLREALGVCVHGCGNPIDPKAPTCAYCEGPFCSALRCVVYHAIDHEVELGRPRTEAIRHAEKILDDFAADCRRRARGGTS